ncbi:hypothetical protein Ddye_008170 [Dipteronia dyeriana]|uniref:HAT C-terminal dimerisation domain-containing protein n=1 Tax=Dipteronia dyeriana TaxID=168575 RepID=A0AAD9X9U6_9ROSI|nr:hypothetical protein Ddye_008170 [Dipteronia dyeriana]
MKIIDCYFPIIYGDRASGEIKKAQDILLRIVREYEGKLKASSYSSSGDPTIVSSSQPTMVHSRLNSLSIFDQSLSSAPSVTTQMKMKLDYYLDEPVIPRADNFDILMWWNVNASKYPTLQCIARDILAIPVSTVASESTFSTSGRFVSHHRSRLHAQTIEALICTQDWLWTQLNALWVTGYGLRVTGLWVYGYSTGEASTREPVLVGGFTGESMGVAITRGSVPTGEPVYLRGFEGGRAWVRKIFTGEGLDFVKPV